MKIGTPSFAHKKLLLSALAVIVLGVATAVTLEITEVTDFIKSAPPEKSGPSATERAEQDKAAQQDKKDFIESPDPVAQPPSSENSTKIELSAKQESNGSVTVLTKLYSVPDGSCTLTISNGAKTHTQTADVIYQPDFSSCAGFSVARDALGAGEWTIELTVNSGATTEKTITFRVN